MLHTPPSGPSRSAALPLCAVALALWAVHVFFIGPLVFTGDEVRYVAYGLGVWRGEGFHPADAAWLDLLGPLAAAHPQQTSPAGHAGALIHSVAYPLLGSAAIALGGLDGARWFSFGLGLAGLTLLFGALRRSFSHREALAGIVAVAFACPLLFYVRLFFAEILLFALNVAVLWIFAARKHDDPDNSFAIGFLLCCLPFVHVKLALEAAVGFGLMLLAARDRGLTRARLAGLAAMAGGMLVLYVLHNRLLFGQTIGGASPAFPASPLLVPDRVLINLFDMRHGLLPNAPHLLFGLLGLGLAARDRDRTSRELLALFAAYFFTMLWANGSEAYAARNWTAAMPFVAYGFARWYATASRGQFAWAMPVMLLSLCLFCVALRFPGAFLDSRNYAVPFDALFRLLPYCHFGYFLPYDFLDHLDARPNAALGLGLAVGGVVGAYAAGHLLLPRRKAAGALLQGLAIAIALFFALVEPVDNVAVALVNGEDASYANLSLAAPRSLAFVRLDNPLAAMKPFGFFTVVLSDGNTAVNAWQTRASAIVPLPPFRPARAVLIANTPDRNGRRWLDSATGATLYARRIRLPGLDDTPQSGPMPKGALQ